MIVNLAAPQDPNPCPDDWYEQRMRNARDALLALCDWTQLPDVSIDKAPWITYRQELRDFPATWIPGPEADFPDQPWPIGPTP